MLPIISWNIIPFIWFKLRGISLRTQNIACLPRVSVIQSPSSPKAHNINAIPIKVLCDVGTYVISPAVDGDPYSSKRRMRSPNCPWRSPNILTGALICRTLGSWANKRSAVLQRSAISLQSIKNCLFTGGFHPRGLSKYDRTYKKAISVGTRATNLYILVELNRQNQEKR